MGENAKTASGRWVAPCMVAATVTMAASLAVCGIRLRVGAPPREEATKPMLPMSEPTRKADNPAPRRARPLTKQEDFRDRLAKAIRFADGLPRTAAHADAAQRAYEHAQAMLLGDGASILPGEEVRKALQDIDAKMASLAEGPGLRDLLLEARYAHYVLEEMRSGTLRCGNEMAVLQRGKWIDPKVRALMSARALAKGRQYKAAGKMDLAWLWFEWAVEYREDNAQAAEELEALDANRRRAIRTGDEHFALGQWASALESYLKVDAAGQDDFLKAKVTECRFRIALAKADQIRAEGKDEEARKAYQEALGIKPSAKDLIEARLTAMSADAQYNKSMADGHAAMKREQWAAARASFQQAQKIRNTAEVRAAIAETRYHENLAKGKEAFDLGQYDGALAYFKLARIFKETEEVHGLISQAQKKRALPDSEEPTPTTGPAATISTMPARVRAGEEAKDDRVLRAVLSQMAVDKGRECKAVGKLEPARVWFEKALELHKENKDAATELALLGAKRSSPAEAGDGRRAEGDIDDRWWSAVLAGNRCFGPGTWAEAMESYLKADQIKKNGSLAAKIAECRFQIALAKADQLRVEGKYEEAAKAYQEALAMKSTTKDLIDARLAMMAADRQYHKLMADGDAAMKRQEWSAARAFYQQAWNIRNTAETRLLIGWTEKKLAAPTGGQTSPATVPATTTPSQEPGR